MANQNLSQFGEKLFVADADHTFIWDTAASISKRVSRNSWLNSGTLTSDAPVTISQTWNAGSNVMTALKVVATDTASGATSNLLELWAGSTPELKFYVAKSGSLSFRAGANFGSISTDGTGRVLLNSSSSAGARVSGDFHIGSNDVILLRDAANTLALRNGAAAQTFNVYGTYTSITDYKRLSLSCSATTGNATIAAPFNSVLAITGGSSNTTIAIVTFAAQAAAPPVGSTVVVAGATPAGYNGTYTVTASTTTSVTYANTTNLPWVSGGTATLSNSGALTLTGAGYLGIGAPNPITKLHVGTNNNGLNIVSVFYNEDNTQGGNAVGFAFMNESGNSTHYKASIVHERTASWARGKLHFLLNNAEGGFRTSLADARMTIQPDGNVGIGTTAPLATLHVNGADVDQNTKRVALFQSNDTNIFDNFSVVGITSADLVVNTFEHRLLDLDFAGAGAASTGTCIRLLRGGVERAGIGLASDEFVITTGATEKLRVSAAGNVGIGTTSPSSKLHVAGELGTNLTTFDSGAAVKITNTTAGKSWLLTSGIINVHNEFFCIRQESVSLTALSIAPTTNNVGIGVNNAASKLTVGNGDIEILTAASGLILKSPDGIRYRITVPNGGASLTITAV